MAADQDEQTAIIQAVRHWGRCASEAILDPSCKKFQTPHVKGFIAYNLYNRCAIVWGDPICAEQDIPKLVEAFHLTQTEQSIPIIYLIASQSFHEWATNQFSLASVEFGKELFMDPYDDPQNRTGEKASLVRRKVKRALKESVTVQEYIPYDSQLEQQIEEVGLEWLKARRGPQVHISQIRIFNNRLGKRWFYALHRERVIGILILNQIDIKQGMLMNRCMVIPKSPAGVSELLITTAITQLRKESCHFLSLGIIPSDQLGSIKNFSPFSTWMTKKLFSIAVKLFRFNKHIEFWDKFELQTEPSYILFSRPHIRLKELIAIRHAFNIRF